MVGLSKLLQAAIVRSVPNRREYEVWIVIAVGVTLAMPCLCYRYLPMVDLPQHEAIVSIMLNLHNPNFAYDSYYVWAPARTLYIAPYLMGYALAHFMSPACAMHVIVFCAALSYPIGILLCMRVLGRPPILGLMTMPLVYNQSFFWGFINFNLAIGLAFVALSLLVGNWSPHKALLFVLVSIAIALTHVYGLVLLASYMGLWLLLGERRVAISRLAALIPTVLGLGVWIVLMWKASGLGIGRWGSLTDRWSNLPTSIAGGWRGNSEEILLVSIFLTIIVISRKTLPMTLSRWKNLNLHQRVAWAFIGVHLVLYFSLPELPVAANKASFRHAELAALALPLTVASEDSSAASTWLRTGLVALALVVTGNGWSHFRRFNQEAKSFDAIISAIPSRSRVAQLTYDRYGRIARVPVYMHFAGYVQSSKGGLVAVSFPAQFWNIPVAIRPNEVTSSVPKGLEWNPRLFETSQLYKYFDYVIVRAAHNRSPHLPGPFPYQLRFQSGPWRLYHRYESHD